MKKVILRLTIAVLVIALAVLGVYFMFFNLNATQSAYKSLETTFGQEGKFQALSNKLTSNVLNGENKSDSFYTSSAYSTYTTYANFVKAEGQTLEKSYIKLHYVSNINDDSMKNVSERIAELDNSLTTVNEKIDQLNTYVENGSQVNKETYLKTILNGEMENAFSCLIEVNEAINVFLLNKYYNGMYNDSLFLNTLQTQVAKKYYLMVKSSERDNNEEANVLEFYKTLAKKNSDLQAIYDDSSTSADISEWYSVYEAAKRINISKLILNYEDYYEANKDNEEIRENIEIVAAQINKIPGPKDFNLLPDNKGSGDTSTSESGSSSPSDGE